MAITARKFGSRFSVSALQAEDVLIVSRTQMGGGNVCIGGFDIRQSKNVRLLTSNGGNQPGDASFQIGQIWKIAYTPKGNLVHPHSEDVTVQSSRLVNTLSRTEAKRFIFDNCNVVIGSLEKLFSGAVHSPLRGASYVDASNVPDHSVCFWVPNIDLTHVSSFDKHKYHYVSPQHDT
jgi:hypothetical protein